MVDYKINSWPPYHPKIRRLRKLAPHFVKGVLRHFENCAAFCQSIYLERDLHQPLLAVCPEKVVVWEAGGWLVPRHCVEEAGEQRQRVPVLVRGQQPHPPVGLTPLIVPVYPL